MGKLLLFLSLLGLAVLAIGTAYYPNNPIFWLASGAAPFQHARFIMMALLGAQLVTRPPRHKVFRVLAGAIALGVSIWAVQETYNYQMPFLDSMAFLASTIAAAVTALERPKVVPTIALPRVSRLA